MLRNYFAFIRDLFFRRTTRQEEREWPASAPSTPTHAPNDKASFRGSSLDTLYSEVAVHDSNGRLVNHDDLEDSKRLSSQLGAALHTPLKPAAPVWVYIPGNGDRDPDRSSPDASLLALLSNAMVTAIETPMMGRNRAPSMVSGEGPAMIPPQLLKDKGKLTIVLDLDETLAWARTGVVSARPYLTELLDLMCPQCETIVWTAGARLYAQRVLRFIDKAGAIQHCVYRHQKWFTDRKGHSPKDITLLGRDISRTIIVDNTAECLAGNPANGVLLDDYNRPNSQDKALYILALLLEELLASGLSVQDYLAQSVFVKIKTIRLRSTKQLAQLYKLVDEVPIPMGLAGTVIPGEASETPTEPAMESSCVTLGSSSEIFASDNGDLMALSAKIEYSRAASDTVDIGGLRQVATAPTGLDYMDQYPAMDAAAGSAPTLCLDRSPEDQVPQPAPDASPRSLLMDSHNVSADEDSDTQALLAAVSAATASEVALDPDASAKPMYVLPPMAT